MWAERGKQFPGAASGGNVLMDGKAAFPADLHLCMYVCIDWLVG